MRRSRSAALLILVALTATGCRGADEPTMPAREPQATWSEEVKEALADGKVTRDEYVAGFQRFQACMTEKGYALVNVDQQSEIIDYSISTTAVDTGADVECYEPHFQALDAEWQVAHEDQSEGAEFMRDCVVAAGHEPATTAAELAKQIEDYEIDLAQCLEERD